MKSLLLGNAGCASQGTSLNILIRNKSHNEDFFCRALHSNLLRHKLWPDVVRLVRKINFLPERNISRFLMILVLRIIKFFYQRWGANGGDMWEIALLSLIRTSQRRVQKLFLMKPNTLICIES